MPDTFTGRQWAFVNGAIGLCMFFASVAGTIAIGSRWTASVEGQIKFNYDQLSAQIRQIESSRTDVRSNNERRFDAIEKQIAAAVAVGSQNAQQLAILTNTLTTSINERQRLVSENDRRHTEAERRVEALEADRIPSVSKIGQIEGKVDRQADKIDAIQRAVDEIKNLVRSNGQSSLDPGDERGRMANRR